MGLYWEEFHDVQPALVEGKHMIKSRPKFDSKAGTYYCSGYRDDTDFHNCHSSFSLDQIKRDPW